MLFQLFSRKLLRYFFPVFLVLLLVSNLFLTGTFYRVVLVLQLVPYFLAPCGYYLNRAGKRLPLISLPYYFSVGVLAAILGLIKVFSFQQVSTWDAFDRRYDLAHGQGGGRQGD